MYAIVEIAGQQFKVEKDQQIFVHRLEGEEGANLDFDKVLLIEDGKKVKVGTPLVEGAKVSATVEKNGKGKKVIIYKYKAKKDYRKKQGHRQPYTKVVINTING